MFHRKPDQVVAWTSTKTSAKDANKQYARKAAEMAAKGYTSSAPLLSEAGHSKRSNLLLPVVGNLLRGKQVQMSAIFTLGPVVPVTPPDDPS